MRKLFPLLAILGLLSACQSAAEAPANAEGSTPSVQAAATESTRLPDNENARFPDGIIYAIELTPEKQRLVQIDAATAVIQTLFLVPENAWLGGIDYQPQREQFVWAYAPAPPAGEVQFGFTRLYLWRIGEAEPSLLFESGAGDHVFFNPVWTPDGQAIYYSHVEPVDEETYTFTTFLKRYHLESGAVDIIAENGIWPALSPDGQQLAYISINPNTSGSTLMLADPDGQNKTVLLAPEWFAAVDAPVFSPDGSTITFSAAEVEVSSRPWWEIVLGLQTAKAHSLPSDWYRLPLTGGESVRLTEIEAVGLYGRFAPNETATFAFASQKGLFSLSPDGENLSLIGEGSYKDSLAWGPGK